MWCHASIMRRAKMDLRSICDPAICDPCHMLILCFCYWHAIDITPAFVTRQLCYCHVVGNMEYLFHASYYTCEASTNFDTKLILFESDTKSDISVITILLEIMCLTCRSIRDHVSILLLSPLFAFKLVICL